MKTIASHLNSKTRITILTGAGVSAASGVPTFRGPDGLWKQFRPESLATPDAFRQNPQLVWEWYDWRRQIIKTKTPNAAHEVLAPQLGPPLHLEHPFLPASIPTTEPGSAPHPTDQGGENSTGDRG